LTGIKAVRRILLNPLLRLIVGREIMPAAG
jgi:hypothetical protein